MPVSPLTQAVSSTSQVHGKERPAPDCYLTTVKCLEATSASACGLADLSIACRGVSYCRARSSSCCRRP